MAIALTNENKDLLDSNGKLVLDFWTKWCGPCKLILPVFEGISEEVKDATFVKINVEEHPEVAAKFDVTGVPTLIVIDGGEVITRVTGKNGAVPLLNKLREGSL